MIRFITKILLISTFFIGLGAIADGVLKTVNPTKNQFAFEQKSECNMQQIKVIQFSNTEKQPQIQMMLPKIEELPKIETPIAHKKVVIFNEVESLD
jgi:hypothetical protein